MTCTSHQTLYRSPNQGQRDGWHVVSVKKKKN